MLQYLVRHGQSVSNVEERVQGQEDVALSELGRRQAEEVAAWAASIHAVNPVTEIWTSPLRRARDTAAAIAGRIDRPLQIEDDLRELHAGVFQGHLWADLELLFPEAVASWRSGDVDYRIREQTVAHNDSNRLIRVIGHVRSPAPAIELADRSDARIAIGFEPPWLADTAPVRLRDGAALMIEGVRTGDVLLPLVIAPVIDE